MRPSPRTAIPLFFLIALGAGVRFYHLDCGLPSVVYVDAFKFVDAARDMVQTSNWAPRDFQYPGFYTHLLAILYGVSGARSVYATHLIALAVSALFSIGLIPLTWLAARQLCSRRGAALAAALTALSLVLVTLARIPATDSILVFFMTAGVWMLAREKVATRHLLAAGVFLGLAIGTKFTGLYLGLFMPLALATAPVRNWARRRVIDKAKAANRNPNEERTRTSALPAKIRNPRMLSGWVADEGVRAPSANPHSTIRNPQSPFPWRALLPAALLALVALLITTPWLLPRFMDYYQRFSLEMLIQRHGQIGRVQRGFLDFLVSPTPTWEQPWLGTSILYNDGPLVLLLGLCGCILGLSYRRGAAAFRHALYVIAYLALISRPGHLKAIRFLAPILPSFYIMTAWMVDRWTGRAASPQRGRLLWGSAAILLLAFPAVKTLSYVTMARGETTQQRAYAWIRTHLPHNPPMLLTPFFLDNLADLSANMLYLPNPGTRQYRLPGLAAPDAERAPVYYPALLDELRKSGARYIVTNSWFDDAFSDIPENRHWFPRATRAYKLYRERLAHQARLIYEDLGERNHRLGPDVRIYLIEDNVFQ